MGRMPHWRLVQHALQSMLWWAVRLLWVPPMQMATARMHGRRLRGTQGGSAGLAELCTAAAVIAAQTSPCQGFLALAGSAPSTPTNRGGPGMVSPPRQWSIPPMCPQMDLA